MYRWSRKQSRGDSAYFGDLYLRAVSSIYEMGRWGWSIRGHVTRVAEIKYSWGNFVTCGREGPDVQQACGEWWIGRFGAEGWHHLLELRNNDGLNPWCEIRSVCIFRKDCMLSTCLWTMLGMTRSPMWTFWMKMTILVPVVCCFQ